MTGDRWVEGYEGHATAQRGLGCDHDGSHGISENVDVGYRRSWSCTTGPGERSAKARNQRQRHGIKRDREKWLCLCVTVECAGVGSPGVEFLAVAATRPNLA
jgi:hypothetical protein